MSSLTLEEIADCRRCYKLGRALPVHVFREMLVKGLPKDFAKKARELAMAGKPHGALDIVEYYWSDPEFQKTCALAQITKEDITIMAYRVAPEVKPEEKPKWYKRIFGG